MREPSPNAEHGTRRRVIGRGLNAELRWLAARRRRQQRVEQLHQLEVVHRLDQVRVEPALSTGRRSSSCPQPVSATITMSLPHGCAADAPAGVVAVQLGMPMSSSTTSGRNCSAAAIASSPSVATCVSLPLICEQQRQRLALSGLSSTTRMRRPRCALAPAAVGALALGRAPRRPAPAAAPRTRCPCRARRCAPSPCRRASRPGASPA